jgi:hypothetical protein
MMLHAPGSAGMTSPVAGMDGAIPLSAQNSTLITASSASTSAADSPASLAADLRWVGTHVLRPVSSSALSQVTEMTADAVPVTDAQQTPLPTVVGMLRSWQQLSSQQVGP